jgi:integrase
MAILPNTEKQGGPVQKGDWQKDMARRRYQKGSIRKRGKRNQVWELQWWEDYIKEDGSIARRRQSATLGAVSEMTLREARKLADERLRPVNQGRMLPQSTMELRVFVERYFDPLFFPTLKRSTQKRYRQTLNSHLLPAFGKFRLCDIGTIDLQQFVLQKMESGLGWESANHLRNLMSKIFETAKKWNYFQGNNPAIGVSLPEKNPVREKHALQENQIALLLSQLKEPVRTMVLLGILTGMRIGEILGLRRKDVNFPSGQIRIEQACYRGLLGSPKTKGSRRTLPLPTGLVKTPLAHMRKGTTNKRRGFGISNSKWHTLERHQLAASSFETSWGTTRDAVAELARSQTYPRHIAPGGWGLTQRCPDTVRSQQDVHDLGGLYHSDPGSSERSGRKPFAIGDQW